MEVCDYPNTKEHFARHQELEAQVHDLTMKWRTGRNPEMLRQLQKALWKLLKDDVENLDLNIAQYTEGKGPEIRQALAHLEQVQISPKLAP